MRRSFFFNSSGISVGVHVESGAEEIARIWLDSKADIAIVDDMKLLKRMVMVAHKLPDLRAIIVLNNEEPELTDRRKLHRLNKVGWMV